MQIPCTQTQPESQTQSQTESESPICDSPYLPTDVEPFQTLPEVVRVFRDMFRGSTTPPDFYFGLSSKMEAGLIPKSEEEDPQWFNEESEGIESKSATKVRNIGIISFFSLLLHVLHVPAA